MTEFKSITDSNFQKRIDDIFKDEKMFFNLIKKKQEGGDGHGFFDHIRKIPNIAGIKSFTATTSPSGDKTYSIQFNGKNQSGGDPNAANHVKNPIKIDSALMNVEEDKKELTEEDIKNIKQVKDKLKIKIDKKNAANIDQNIKNAMKLCFSKDYSILNEFFEYDEKLILKETIEKTIAEINEYSRKYYSDHETDIDKKYNNSDSDIIFKKIVCFSWNKAKSIASNHLNQKGGDIVGLPETQITTLKEKKINVISIAFGIMMLIFSSVLVYQTYVNLDTVFREIYSGGVNEADLFPDNDSVEKKEATYTILTFFIYFKNYITGAMGNQLIKLEQEFKLKAQEVLQASLEKAKDTNSDIWGRGWAVGITEYASGFFTSQVTARTISEASFQAQQQFNTMIHENALKIAGYGASIGSAYICMWVSINMFATAPIIIFNQFYPEKLPKEIVYKSFAALATATTTAASTASNSNILAIGTCITATVSNYKNLYNLFKNKNAIEDTSGGRKRKTKKAKRKTKRKTKKVKKTRKVRKQRKIKRKTRKGRK